MNKKALQTAAVVVVALIVVRYFLKNVIANALGTQHRPLPSTVNNAVGQPAVSNLNVEQPDPQRGPVSQGHVLDGVQGIQAPPPGTTAIPGVTY